MTNPTHDEITAARELLLRVPGFTNESTLADIELASSPLRRMANDLRERLLHTDPEMLRMHTAESYESTLKRLAKANGLRITTDPEPGELIGYQLVDKVDGASWERRSDRGWLFRPDDIGLGVARDATQGSTARIAAVFLLPEGGKA